MQNVLLTLMLLLAAGQALALGQLADISIYDRVEQRTLPVYWHEGRAYVIGKPGNEYRIALHNRGGADVLAVVSVDGVNVVTGETAAASQSGYVIDNWRSLEVNGWRKSLARTAAFYFTDLPDSYAARTGRADNVGVIGVALFQRRVESPPLSLDMESPFKRKGRAEGDARSQAAPQTAEKSLGTGHGRGETSFARQVGFERATSGPEEMITLYYDSYANLVARGVISAGPRHHHPQPFPSYFVPDPPQRW